MRFLPFLLAAASLLGSNAAWAQTTDLALQMDGSVDQVPVGRQVTYELTVTNQGPADTTSFTLVDTLPTGKKYLGATSGAGVSGNTVAFTGGPLAAGASVSYQIAVETTASGSLVNSATVTNSSTDPDTSNNTAQYTVIAGSQPVATLVATVPSVIAETGNFAEFTVSLSAAPTVDTVLNFAIQGTAINGTDYTLLKTTKKIKAGKTSKNIKIFPQGDLGGASKKTVKLTLAPGDGYTVGTTDKVKVKILAPAN